MLTLISFEKDAAGTRGNVVFETSEKNVDKAHEELKGKEARQMAISKAAAEGMPDPGINDTPFVYPVDANGEPLKGVLGQQTSAYRVRIPVIRKLV